VGKIADAYVEIGADDGPFTKKIKDIAYQVRRASFNMREDLKYAFSADALKDLAYSVRRMSFNIRADLKYAFSADAMKDLVYSIRRASFNIKATLKETFSADVVGTLVTRLTGSGDAGYVASALISSGFGKAILVMGGVAIAVAAVAVALDYLYSRSEDQKFADSVAGLTGGFRGLAEEIKHTDKKIAELMSSDATGGTGGWLSLESWKALGERLVGIETMTSQIAKNMQNAVVASKLYAGNMVKAAIASREQSQSKAGAVMFAGLRRTAAQQDEMGVNAEAMKRVLDEEGGARVAEQVLNHLRKNPSMVPSGVSEEAEAQRVAGALEEGDIETARLFGDLFDLPAKRAQIMGEEFDKATGRAEELAHIQQEQQRKEKEFRDAQIKRMQRETEQASKDMLKLEEQREKTAEKLAEFEEQRTEKMQSAFNFQGLAEARDRLFMAAKDNQKDDLTAGKMREEISRVVDALGKLQAKWGMV
jgi:hypothetical protein